MPTGPKKELLVSQKDRVFRLIERVGQDPGDFSWDSRPSRFSTNLRVPLLRHRAENRFYFCFDNRDNTGGQAPPHELNDLVEFSPGAQKLIDIEKPGGWQAQLAVMERWLGYLRRELQAPDLWGALAQQRRQLALVASPDVENTTFSAAEQGFIAERLGQIERLLIESRRLDQEQQRSLHARLDGLVEAAALERRKDWADRAFGVIVSVLINLTVDTSTAQTVVGMAAALFGHLFGGSGGPPPLLPGATT